MTPAELVAQAREAVEKEGAKGFELGKYALVCSDTPIYKTKLVRKLADALEAALAENKSIRADGDEKFRSYTASLMGIYNLGYAAATDAALLAAETAVDEYNREVRT